MPNRILKDSICTSDSIASLTDFQETFFYRLIVNCDDYGRMDARPAILKARLYPLRERLTLTEIQSALRALAAVGCVEVYEVDGKPYLRLPSWEVHQQIRAKKSKYPAPVNACNQMISNDIKCPRNPIQSESNPNPNPNPNPIQHAARAKINDADDGFAVFWEAYPVKSGCIERAYMEYQRAIDSGATLKEMLAALEWQTEKWAAQGMQFVPSAEKWLHNRGWTAKRSEKEPSSFAEMWEQGVTE